MKPNLLGWILAAVLMLWALASLALGGECPARTLEPGEALDRECKLFRVVREGNERWIEVLEFRSRQASAWHRDETIDCGRAKKEEGVLKYHARSVAADFYCGGVK